ncbi:hypothetical protein AB6A40_004585 [Gnathostoma spinigerum]|uniref:Uncharacterized protein n=1 Tax=Gnathostoma spinigerum TaxID=75299 RepID=A0ABD6EKC8_9BILA
MNNATNWQLNDSNVTEERTYSNRLRIQFTQTLINVVITLARFSSKLQCPSLMDVNPRDCTVVRPYQTGMLHRF